MDRGRSAPRLKVGCPAPTTATVGALTCRVCGPLNRNDIVCNKDSRVYTQLSTSIEPVATPPPHHSRQPAAKNRSRLRVPAPLVIGRPPVPNGDGLQNHRPRRAHGTQPPCSVNAPFQPGRVVHLVDAHIQRHQLVDVLMLHTMDGVAYVKERKTLG